MAVRRKPLSAKTLATHRAKAKKSKLFKKEHIPKYSLFILDE